MRNFLVIIAFFVISPVFALDYELDNNFNHQNEVNSSYFKKNEESYPKVLKKRAQVRPKREQKKTLLINEKFLNKNKEQFKMRIKNELNLLNDEYEILEYQR